MQDLTRNALIEVAFATGLTAFAVYAFFSGDAGWGVLLLTFALACVFFAAERQRRPSARGMLMFAVAMLGGFLVAGLVFLHEGQGVFAVTALVFAGGLAAIAGVAAVRARR
jgi:FtsH-binding integral membrane protein